MGDSTELGAQASHASDGKAPRTPRGERTLRKILDAARDEFGERGFSESSIAGITQRAGVALGTFYTYFDSKEAVFRALVRDMSAQVREFVAPMLKGASDTLDAERRALESFLRFTKSHRQVYRIIDEAEFVDPDGFRNHYETTAARIAARLAAGRAAGDIGSDLSDHDLDALAWAIMGANVFLGLKYSVWSNGDPARIANAASRLLRKGLEA